jgi:hypothetical protein
MAGNESALSFAAILPGGMVQPRLLACRPLECNPPAFEPLLKCSRRCWEVTGPGANRSWLGFARGFSTEALVERFEPMVSDLAWDIMMRETQRLTGLSNTQAKGHWNRATEAVVERMLALGGICPRLLGDEYGGLVFRHRRSFRSAILKRLRDGWRFEAAAFGARTDPASTPK